MALKVYSSVQKILKLKFGKDAGPITTFAEVKGKK